MEKYFLQERIGEYIWFDLYTKDLYMLKKMIIALKRRNPNAIYRIVGVYK